MTSMLAVVPVVWEQTADQCIESMLKPHSSLGLEPHEILIVDNTRNGYLYGQRDIVDGAGRLVRSVSTLPTYRDPDGHNLGVAGAWNVGARAVLDRKLDWLVIVSTSMLFGPELHTTFRREIEAHEGAQIVECMGNSWHLIAIARSTLETVGLFDENFWPAYEESIDWGYRQKLLGLEAQGWPRVWCNAMSVGAALHVKRENWDAPSCPAQPLLDYYDEKWGGPKGQERYTRPFGDASLPLDYWKAPPIPMRAARYGCEVWW